MPVSTLQIGFEEPTPRLLVQLEAGVTFENEIPFHVFPSDPDKVAVTVGTERFDGTRVLPIKGEIVKFEQVERSPLKYPGATGATITAIPGATFRSKDLSEISPRFVLDIETSEILALDTATNAPVEIVGGVAVDYSANYARYLYTPETSALGNGTRQEYGSILAIKGRSVETLAIDVEIGDISDFVEAYRVVSTIVANNEDRTPSRWEKPPNWPEDGKFATGEEVDPDNAFDDERIHELGYVNRVGFTRFEWFIHPLEKPYTGSSSFTPEYKLIRQSPPNEEYTEAFAEIQWDDVLASLQARWPGVSE